MHDGHKVIAANGAIPILLEHGVERVSSLHLVALPKGQGLCKSG